MINVLQIVSYMYPFRGGMNQVAENIMSALMMRGDVNQKVLCMNEDAESDGIITHRNETSHDKVNGVEVIRCGVFAKIASQSISLLFRKKLAELMSNFSPDIIILHYPNPFAAFMLMPFLRKRKTKLVVYWHLDIVRQKILGKLFHWQNIRLLNRADAVVATSQAYIDNSRYLSMFRDKCTVIPCCIQTETRTVTPEVQRKAEAIRQANAGKAISFSAGRLVPYKGFDYLIEASQYLSDDFAVFIAGTGAEEARLKKMARGKNKVHLLGYIDDEDLNAYYLACDMIAFSSITKNEAFGIALAEGMYFGKPAVTFTIPGSGVNYVSIDGVTGLECSNRDVRAYAGAMMRLKDDNELRERLGRNARQRVLENFMYEHFRESINALISSLM